MNLRRPDSIAIPDDLRTWVSENRLVHLVFEAIHRVEERMEPASRLPTGMPRTILSLLSYAYAIGIYGSDELESKLPVDWTLDYLAAKSCLSAHSFRLFRRQHRLILEQTLTELLQLCWTERDPGSSASIGWLGSLLDQEARWRVEEAILIDSAMLDA